MGVACIPVHETQETTSPPWNLEPQRAPFSQGSSLHGGLGPLSDSMLARRVHQCIVSRQVRWMLKLGTLSLSRIRLGKHENCDDNTAATTSSNR